MNFNYFFKNPILGIDCKEILNMSELDLLYSALVEQDEEKVKICLLRYNVTLFTPFSQNGKYPFEIEGKTQDILRQCTWYSAHCIYGKEEATKLLQKMNITSKARSNPGGILKYDTNEVL